MEYYVAVATGLIRLTVEALIIVGCIWAYRRFHFKSVPWILAFFIIKEIVPFFDALLIRQGIILPASANGDVMRQMKINDVAAILYYASSVVSILASAIIAWFAISELTNAYSATGLQPTLPVFLSFPMRHSYAVGIALLLFAVVIPLCGIMFSIMWT